MLRYIARRLLMMIPTVLGVVLITFILFHVAGGDPALSALGPQASARDLEEFRVARGLHRPLFCGWWASTYAHPPADLQHNPGAWPLPEGVTWTRDDGPGRIVIAPGVRTELPLAMTLRRDATYRLTLNVRGGAGGAVLMRAGPDDDPEPIKDLASTGRRFRPVRAEFATGSDPRGLAVLLQAGDESLEIASARLDVRQDRPWRSQLGFFLGQIARFDFGTSHYTRQPVAERIRQGVLPSLSLTVPMFFLGLSVTIVLALFCAFFRDTWFDRVVVVAAVALMSINYLIWIVLGQYIFAFRLGAFPVWGYESPRYLVLPILIGTVSGLGGGLRYYRTFMLDEMYKEYVRAAFAKGVSRSGVLFGHVLKNALIPVVTHVVVAIPFLYTGSLLLESFFGIPGLGYLGVEAFNTSDVDVIRALVLIGSALFVLANLAADLCYAMVDPRVSLR